MKTIIEKEDGTVEIDGITYAKKEQVEAKTTPRTKEQAWAEMVSGLERKEDLSKYPDSVFWFKEGKLFFEQDEKKAIFWCSWHNVWSIFENEFGMKYSAIQDYTKGMVEEHFKCNGVITCFPIALCFREVEEHFKCNGVITEFVLFD